MERINISFGKKIPISQHNVYDRKQEKFVTTTLYEIDAKDESDIEYIKSQQGNWGELRDDIADDITVKHSKLSAGEKNIRPKNKFYSLENSEGNAIGLMEIRDYPRRRNLFLFECDPDKNYKFVGQVMLSQAAKAISGKKNYTFTVDDPTDEGRIFYINACGFKEQRKGSHGLKLNRQGIDNFINNVEERTHAKKIDVTV
ncbi:hypothetical protein IJ843_08400 [bacterium]|nr:hypothetical protein [bacterium]